MTSSANPHATQAGVEVLAEGGSAVDAAVAVQMVLTLVEPQSSGIGGGAFMLHWSPGRENLEVFEGRETAPAAATPELFLGDDGKPLGFIEAAKSGRAVGVPGVVAMLELAHKKHGRLPWTRLFDRAIQLASDGFEVSPRMHALISWTPALADNPVARALYFGDDGKPLAVGATLKNPALAATLKKIAENGADAFYSGHIAQDIVDTVTSAANRPGSMTLDDIASYRPKMRDVVCKPYRKWTICGMPPPSSGGVTVMQILAMLEPFDMASLKPNSVESVHLFAEASKLAYADRALYLADSDFVDVPVEALLDRAYLLTRSLQIDRNRAMSKPQAGDPLGQRANLSPDLSPTVPSTSHFSIVDETGAGVAMTTSVETAFGSNLITNGFVLNNQLTDFSFEPMRDGKPVANAPGGGKRPRSSMSPTLVFDGNGDLHVLIGSPGGGAIIEFVAKTLVGVLDWDMDMQSAIALPNIVAMRGVLTLEDKTSLNAIKGRLEALGHKTNYRSLGSGLHGIRVTPDGLDGGADPRREGVAAGAISAAP
jgi:gamma-glutamyltranspeptidase/glutathione hydrolase